MSAAAPALDTMRQAVIVAPDRFEVQAAPRPVLRGDGEVLLRTAACGICSGDLMTWYLARKIGTVLGHEPVGRAVEVGRAVRHIQPGDLVFTHHHAPCGSCAECARGAAVHCPTWKRTVLDPGGMAEWIRVPEENVRADTFAVNDIPAERALFIEPLGCCVKALRRAGGRERMNGARVVVVGCGVMGLLNIAAARAFGAERIDAVEPETNRREAARDLGASTALTPAEAGKALAGAADLVIVGPGHSDVIRQALAYVRPGGIALLFTPTAAGTETALDLGELYFRDVSLVPSYSCGPEDTGIAYDLLRRAEIQPERMITHRFPLDQVQTAYDTARHGGAALKVIVTLASEASREQL